MPLKHPIENYHSQSWLRNHIVRLLKVMKSILAQKTQSGNIINYQNMIKQSIIFFVFPGIILSACYQDHHKKLSSPTVKREPMNIFDLYTNREPTMMYSAFVSDSFMIFSSLPQKYDPDSVAKYPLILVLDANGYFESVVAELKLGTLTQGFPPSIVIGIGYTDFWAMDSLRNRDYTYPIALPEDEFGISGGAQRFKKFINLELLPKLTREYHVDQDRIMLLGHSLGGYFVLYYMLDSFQDEEFKITSFIAASPSLWYNRRYLFDLEKKLRISKDTLPVKLYVSMGSLERDTTQKENAFMDLKTQLEAHHYPGSRFKFIEYGNFGHMEAAMPGFINGLVFSFEE